ncbi:MAG: polysaccharide export protein [Thermoanaerobaculales bacterium]|nr:polysaccharide export protein [Thermoanaerobaculales bacterium]
MRIWLTVFICVVFVALPVGAQEEQNVESAGYEVGIGDVIEVTAFQEDEITGEFLVEASGAITFPLLGSVPVAGMTPASISLVLEELLERDYYVDVQLKVKVEVFASQPVTLLGEVQTPGTYYLEGRTTLTELLSKAGGLRSSAGPVLELRRTARADGEGPPEPMIFETAKLSTGESGRDVILQAGDVLYVSPKKIYFITGEVARPGQYEISLGMTLMQALSQAGGVGKFASQVIEIHREVDGEKEILSFDLSHIRKGRLADPAVTSGDVIFVKRRFF